MKCINCGSLYLEPIYDTFNGDGSSTISRWQCLQCSFITEATPAVAATSDTTLCDLIAGKYKVLTDNAPQGDE